MGARDAASGMTGFGHGKVILLGEHAVVYGHPALAGALAIGVEVKAVPAREAGSAPATSERALGLAHRLRLPAWGLDTAADPDGPPARALAAILACLRPSAVHDLFAHAEIPARAGLGSSAALAVAAARALLFAEGRPPRDELVEEAAMAAERVFHGNPSGVDVALAARGGLGLFRRGEGLSPIAAPPLRLAIGASGVGRDTAALVQAVARRLRDDPVGAGARLGALGELALAGRDALAAGRPERLGPLFDHAQEHLAWLGVSSPMLDRLCDLARRAGATGAKLTGAGGGGAVIAVGDVEAVAAAWREAGHEAWVVDVGATRRGP